MVKGCSRPAAGEGCKSSAPLRIRQSWCVVTTVAFVVVTRCYRCVAPAGGNGGDGGGGGVGVGYYT